MYIKHRTSPSVLLQHFLDTDAHNLLSKSHVILLSSFEKKCSNFHSDISLENINYFSSVKYSSIQQMIQDCKIDLAYDANAFIGHKT